MEADLVVRTGDVAITLASLPPVSNVPELATPTDQELGIIVIDPGVPVPHQGVGQGVAPELVEVDHPEAVVWLRGNIQSSTTWTPT